MESRPGRAWARLESGAIRKDSDSSSVLSAILGRWRARCPNRLEPGAVQIMDKVSILHLPPCLTCAAGRPLFLIPLSKGWNMTRFPEPGWP
jgi:hypothetical protein